MRIAILLAAMCAATATLAQDVPIPSAPFAAEYDRSPDARDFRRHYPEMAQRHNKQGVSVLCCVVRNDRGLNCAVAFEAPRSEGFGDASIVVSQEYRLSQASYERYRANPYNFIRQTFVWDSPYGRTGEFQDALENAERATANVCRAPVAAGPIPPASN